MAYIVFKQLEKRTQLLTTISLLISFICLIVTPPINALSQNDIKAINLDTVWHKYDYQTPTAGGTSGASGCISGKLPTITDETAFAAALTSYLQGAFPQSPFLQIADFGKIMVESGKRTGVNPMLVMAIGAQETGMGTNTAGSALDQGSHNAFGMTAGSSEPGIQVGNFKWLVWPSFEASINSDNDIFVKLKAGYVDDPNVATFERIINKYLTGSVDGTTDSAGNKSSVYIDNATQTINQISSQPNSGVQCSAGSAAGASIVAIAAAELGVHEEPDGSNCLPSVQNKYMGGVCESWCANFVSWVYMAAGVPFTGGYSGGWRINNVIVLLDWFKANANWYPRDPASPAPQPGDVIIFSYSGSSVDNSGSLDHTGIIESVNGSDLTVIEGNSSNRVQRVTYSNYATDSVIVGWGRSK
jgi:hypothetical protein